MDRIFRYCLLLSMSLGIACSNKPEQKNPFVAQGVQDSGGGSAAKSTPSEIGAALDLALKLISEPDPRRNIVIQFWTDWGRLSKREFIKNPYTLFPNLNAGSDALDLSANHDLISEFQSPALSGLIRSNIVRRAAGDCALVDHEHKDASVSEFSLSAEVCFSIGNLTRVPPASLLREVTALVLHEVIHLAGVRDEDQARAWQAEFSNYFGARFGDLSSDTVTPRTMKKLTEAKILLAQAQARARVNPKGPHVYSAIGKLTKELSTIPNFLDPLALQIKLKPEHPELIGNYSNSVLSALEKIQDNFDVKYIHISVLPGIRPSVDTTSPEKALLALDELERLLWHVNENFLAFVGGETAAKSVCILPTRDLNLKTLDTSQMGAVDSLRIFIPPRVCPKI